MAPQDVLDAATPRGLSDDEVLRRRARYGPNRLPAPPGPSLLRRVLRSLGDPLVLVLLASLTLTLVTGDVSDAIVIGIVITVNTILAVQQELRADDAVEALGKLVSPTTRVIRSGRDDAVPVADLVPGDLIVLRQGDLVPADALLLEATALRVDESTLTGESVPVDKSAAGDDDLATPVGGDTDREAAPLPETDPDHALSAGTVIVHGRGLARVTATGSDSALGRIAAMVGSRAPTTPLQRRMARLSAVLAVAAISLSLVVLAVGLVRGQPLELMVLTTIALIVAAVPESLPLVVTVSLALAARRMAVRRAIVRNLAAVETLGSVTLLATDKTGTLTIADMTVHDVWSAPGVPANSLWRALAVCNDAVVGNGDVVHGDPTERALLRAAADAGHDVTASRAAYPRVSEVPFDSTSKRMVTVHEAPSLPDEQVLVVCKGAPEAVLREPVVAAEPAQLDEVLARAERMAMAGSRVIAVADRVARSGQEASPDHLRLLGLIGLRDPLRDSSRDTVLQCRAAGMRVVLVTGDHPTTAHAIADEAGIATDGNAVTLGAGKTSGDVGQATDRPVIARATPADKLALVQAWQGSGEVVAMTGDGVNDAPALRRADIGVAMGGRGTEVARQSADLVLADDNLATVVAAVEEGRRVYANIRRFLLYGLAGGASEVALMLLGPAVGIALPLLPAQILWVNLLTHSFAGAGLATQEVDPGAMTRPPRSPDQGVLAEGLWWRILVLALYIAVASLAVGLAVGGAEGKSATLLALGAGQLAVAWGVRTVGSPVWRGGRPADPLLLALFGAALLLVASVLVPPLMTLLGTHAVGPEVWGLVALTSLVSYVFTRLLGPRTF